MSAQTEFKTYILDQLSPMGEFETKNMFGGTAVLKSGAAFAKIKHGCLWLKVDDQTVDEFIAKGMPQYTYGKDNSRKLNFYEAPPELLEDQDALIEWANKASDAALRSKS
ncbi:TfoX/Sxy family protein [Magnetovibrio sp. PR-2]|uniref:TfoX/Sxy family protein n=1 Tax=Magnetovibrio sp. PR-2 TaxID=3120356 RepID=UPI002FCE5CAF